MIEKIKSVIEPVLKEEGCEVVELVFRREAGRQVLRLLVDRDGGIKLGDCVRLNQILSRMLDESDAITERYILEVDSPGVDRWFCGRRDYERAVGRMVRVTLSETISEKKEHIGRLQEILEDSIKVDTGKKKGIIEVPFDKIVRARQEVEF
ncbi:MAG: ribosome maturation factor RimP [Candidatus Omnitrophica bacterium]|nr:ribosome maturation factor RimP [Candidatus Omnitrophota bacterium]